MGRRRRKKPKTAKIVGGDTQGEGEAEKKGTLLLLLLRTRASRGGAGSLRIREFNFFPQHASAQLGISVMESVVIRAGEKRRAGKRAETGEESSVSLPSREIPRGKGEKW